MGSEQSKMTVKSHKAKQVQTSWQQWYTDKFLETLSYRPSFRRFFSMLVIVSPLDAALEFGEG